MFWDEELDAILDIFVDDVPKAAGCCLRIIANDPDRIMDVKDATAGAFTLLSLMRLYADRGDRWLGSE